MIEDIRIILENTDEVNGLIYYRDGRPSKKVLIEILDGDIWYAVEIYEDALDS